MEKCKRKWIPLDEKLMNEYEITPRKCKICCRINHPQFVHAKDGDSGEYTCYICKRDGSLKIFCFHCKKIYN